MLFFVGCFLAAGCGDDEGEQDYYVRYTAAAEPGEGIDVTYVDEKGENRRVQTVAPGGEWQCVVGVVRKGFKAHVLASYVNGDGAVRSLRIEVCRGAEPFAVKAIAPMESSYFALTYVVEE